MVALFVSLKLTLLRNRLRRPAALAQLVIGAILVALLAAFLLALLAGARGLGAGVAADLFVMLCFFQLVGWAVTPLLVFGVDETLDARRFALLPLSQGTLLRGLLAAALIGVFPIGNAIVLVGGALAISSPLWTLVLALPAAVLQLLLCVLLSRAMAATMSGLLSSRRGRDLAILFGLALVLLPQLTQVAAGRVSQVTNLPLLLAELTAPMRWLPPGALAHVAADAAAGAWAMVAYDLGIGVVTVALVAWWWRAALSRSLVRPDSSTIRDIKRRRGLPGLVETLVPGRVGVVAAADLRMTWRDPMRRMNWVIIGAVGLLLPYLPMASGASGPTGGPYGGVFLAFFLGLVAINQLGYDGSGLWQHLVTGGGRGAATAEIWGHTLAVLVPAVVLVPVSVVTGAVVGGHVSAIVGAFGLAIPLLAGTLAGSALGSVWLPYGVPQKRTSAFASNAPGQGAKAMLAVLVAVVIGVVSVFPALAFLLLGLAAPVFGWLVPLVGVVTAAVVLPLAVRLAGAQYADRGPSILAMASTGDRV